MEDIVSPRGVMADVCGSNAPNSVKSFSAAYRGEKRETVK